ncbi:hypothetical protein [Lepagella muris]|jgi:hypothetical protein|nr:hypothetical protein [Lepagella muris]
MYIPRIIDNYLKDWAADNAIRNVDICPLYAISMMRKLLSQNNTFC